MSFREKTAWVTLISLVLVSLMYWLHVPSLFKPHPRGWVLAALGISIGTFLLIEAVAWLVFFLRNPKEARTPKDEREQLIALKATRIAYGVFTAGRIPRRPGGAASGRCRSRGPGHVGSDRVRAGPAGTQRGHHHLLPPRRVMTSTAVTNNIRRLRFEHREITQQELADRIGVTRQTVNAIEAGKYSPSLEVAFRIAKVFGLRLEEVFQFGERARGR